MDTSDLVPDGSDPAAQQLRRQWGKAIAAQRQALGLTQQKLAEELNVTRQAVSAWEGGDAAPRPHIQVAIASALGVAWSVLFQPGQKAAS